MFRDEVRERLGAAASSSARRNGTANPVTAGVVVLHGDQAVAARLEAREEHVRRPVGVASGAARSASTSSAMFT